MVAFLTLAISWGPVFFGVLIFAPMLAALLDVMEISQLSHNGNLALAMVIGGLWGLVAKIWGRWI